MSLYFDLVINCYFREDIAEEHVKVLRWLTDPSYELDFVPILTLDYPDYDFGNVWENIKHISHMLAPAPEYQIISRLERIHYTTIPLENNREVHLWLLQFNGRWIHDDGFYESYLPCIYWLASIARDGLFGYWRQTDYPRAPTHLIFSNNHAVERIKVDSPIQPPNPPN